MIHFENDWEEILADEFKKDYYQNLRKKLYQEYKTQTVYPDAYDLFNALHLTSFKDTKVVILGQDPYHEPGQANGLCFSVKEGTPLPPSLKNIYKELENDLGIEPVENGDLSPWAKQGVLLLNSSLSVRAHQAASHSNLGWSELTDAIIKKLSDREDPIVFILWGNFARSKKNLIAPHHLVLESAHPSPLSASRGFFGSKPFSKANAFLEEQNKEPINWDLNF